MTRLPAEVSPATRSQDAATSQRPDRGRGDPASSICHCVIPTQSQQVKLKAKGSFLSRVSDVSLQCITFDFFLLIKRGLLQPRHMEKRFNYPSLTTCCVSFG